MDEFKLKQLKRKLLNGEVICSVSSSEMYRALLDEETAANVAEFLDGAGYDLLHLESGNAFLMIDSSDFIKSNKDGFSRVVETFYKKEVLTLKALLEIFDLLFEVGAASAYLSAGSRITTEHVAGRVSVKPETIDKSINNVINLVKSLGTKITGNTTLDRIEKVFKLLVDMGYLVPDGYGTSYTVTGKIALFHQMCEFETERLDISSSLIVSSEDDEEGEVNGELF